MAMAEIIPLGQRNATETLAEFVRREGAVTTAAVAHRFGWDTKRAYAELAALRKSGVLISKHENRGASIQDGGGRQCGWRIATETDSN